MIAEPLRPDTEAEEEVFVLPVSYAQRRLWFVDRMEPGSSLYNVPAAWRLRGALDPAALARALDGIVARHEVLRTTFEVEEGEPVQVVHPHRHRPLPTADLSGLSWEGILSAEAARPFDLERGPLFRALLLRLGPGDHVLFVNVHHIVSDGRSLAIFARELSALYGGETLADLPVQYADFAVWQREWLAGGEMEAQLAWWRERLADAPPVQELPMAGARPAVRERRGAWRTLPLPSAGALEALGRREGATPFVALMAAFQALLFRLTPFSGRADVVVGTPIDNRSGEETEGLIGLFVNTLALRTDLAGDPTFRELLGRVRTVALEAYAHQDLPFERLVEELRPERDLSHDPVVQVVFGLQEGTGGLRLAGLEVEPLEVHHGRVKLDLAMSVERGRGARIDYDADLFDEAAAGRLLESFAALIEGAAARPDLPLGELPVLTKAVRRQVVVDWNAMSVEPEPGPAAVHQWFEAWADRTPDAPALISDGGTVSYSELDARANRLAHSLIARGVKPETRVAVVMRHSPERVVALLGVLKAGGVYVSLDPGDPRLPLALEDCGAAVVISGPDAPDGPSARPDIPVDGGQLAYVIYTSGSTGRPKGVEVPHRGLLGLVRWHRRAYGVTPDDRAPQMAGEGFDASVWELWPYLASGAAVVFPPEGARANPAALVPWLAGAGITLAFLPTPVAELALDEPWPEHRLRALLVGGDRLRRRPDARHRFRLVNHYGPTESSVVATWGEVLPEGAGTPPIGRPVDGTRAYVLDRSGRPLPAGVAGELCLGGEGLARGYLGRPDLTAERFVPDPFSRGGRLYRTGDLVRHLVHHRNDGEIEFLGRIDHQVKIRGVRVELGEIEAVLAQHPEVRESVVTVREERLVAYVAPHPLSPSPIALPPARERGNALGSLSNVPPLPGAGRGWERGTGGEGLRAFLAARLPAAMVPSAFVVLDALPLTSSGKVDLRALPDPEWDDGAGAGFAAPRTPVEELLAAIWSEVLGRSPIGIRDGFFELGGHSLLATQVVSRVRKNLGVELPLRALFEAPTVAGLAERIEAARRGGGIAVPPIVPVPRAGELPASFGQERLWFLDQLGEGGAAYNIPAILRLSGSLSVPRLAAALNEVVRRHEALRTTFALADESRVLQVVAPELHLPLPVIELSEAEARRVAEAEAARPFDLARGPLLRALLLKTGEDEHRLLLLMHHIVSDGWSMGVLLRELMRLYEGTALPPLPVQYADVAAWQRGWLRGETLERQLGWWRERLAGLPPLLELPADRPRPPVQGTRGGRADLFLGPALGEALDGLGRSRGATLFMTLLAGFQALLGRLTGREDPPVGTPIANRHRAETEGLIGLFVNTLALPADLSGDPSFADLLARVRDVTLDAYAFQDLPFEKLVEELRPERGLSHSPVFQVLLVVQNAPLAPPAAAGLALEPLPVETGTAKFDLTLAVVDRPAGRRLLQAEYSRDLFDRATVARFLGSLTGLLESAAADPGRRLSDLALLTESERHQALIEWNDTAAMAALHRTGCLHDLVAAQAGRTPDAVAVACQGERVTYGELLRRSRRLANHLRELGVRSERPVGVCLERSPDLVAALLGILQAGGAYLPIDPTYPAGRLALLLEDCDLVVTRGPLLDRLPGQPRAVCLDTLGEASDADPQAGVLPEHLAYLIYTSGSTGRPKGVAIEHRNAVALVRWAAEVFPPEDLAGVLASTSINFDLSVFELFVPLSLGGTVILADNALALAGLPEAGEVRLVNTVPSAMAELLRLEAIPPSVRTVCLAGEPLSQALVAQIERHPGLRVLDLYGPSEDTTYSTFTRRRGDEPATIGRPLANGRACVLDRWQRPAPIGAPGEVWLGGAGVARGYLHRPDLTAERFVPDPFKGEGERLYRTGDLARFRADGRLEYLGRIDHQVKVRGFRIELGEIEYHLLACPGVKEAAVLAVGEGGDRRLVAWVAGDGQGDLRALLAARLPIHMVPSAISFVDALPRLPNGKVDRRALAARGLPDQGGQDGFVEPGTEDELRMAAIWAEVLGLPRVGLHDDFFRLGGHSLLATRIVARVRRDFDVQLPLRALFQAPTVARLLAAVQEARTASAPPAVPRISSLSRSASNLRSRSAIGRKEGS